VQKIMFQLWQLVNVLRSSFVDSRGTVVYQRRSPRAPLSAHPRLSLVFYGRFRTCIQDPQSVGRSHCDDKFVRADPARALPKEKY